MSRQRDELVVLRACDLMGAVLATEERTRTALRRASLTASGELMVSFVALLNIVQAAQRSILYAVDRDALVQACASADALPPEGLALPPLPFPNIICEASTNDVWHVTTADDSTGDEAPLAVEVFSITEVRPGVEWFVVFYIRDEQRLTPETEDTFSPDHPMTMMPMVVDEAGAHVSREAVVQALGENWVSRFADDLYAIHERSIWWHFIVEAMHFITARGVDRDLSNPSRSMRRRALRGGYSLPPHVYFVTIRDHAASPSDDGSSGTAYSCRWLVRGHWRHLSAAKRTWVHPYIKGPPGTPWRGRPVYEVNAA